MIVISFRPCLAFDCTEMKISKFGRRIVFRQSDRRVTGKRSPCRRRCHLDRVTCSFRPDITCKYLVCREAFLIADQLPAIVPVAVAFSSGLDLFRNKSACILSAGLLYESIRRDQMSQEVSGWQVDPRSIRDVPYVCCSCSGLTCSGIRSVDRDHRHIDLTGIQDIDQCIDRHSNITDDIDLLYAFQRFDRDVLACGDRQYSSIIADRRASCRALFKQHLRFLSDDIIEPIPVNIVI